MSLKDFYFCSWKCIFICCCSMTNTVISLVAHKLHPIHMNYQEKVTTRPRSSKSVHRANSQTISSYSVRFSTDILFSSLASFAFCPLVIFVVFCLFLKSKAYILIHIRLCWQVSDKNVFTQTISGNKTTFFLAWGISFNIIFLTILLHKFTFLLASISVKALSMEIDLSVFWYFQYLLFDNARFPVRKKVDNKFPV